METTIKIIEENNQLRFDGEYEPIVCGNSVYSLNFEFGEKWNLCNNKTAVFLVDDKYVLIQFSGNKVNVPVLPNASCLSVSLLSGNGDNQLATTALKINLKTTPAINQYVNLDLFENYLQKIHAAVNKIENGNLAVKTSDIAKNVINENLLINGDFRINQRNWTSGNSATYTLDRWKNVNTFGRVSLNSDGTVTISAEGGTAYFIQKLEQHDGNRIKGKVVTLSACDSDGNIYSKSGKISPEGSSTPSLQTSWGYLRIFYHANSNIFEITVHVMEGKSITLKWVKLEIGPVATEYCSRPYVQELAMCQRYYQVVNINNSGFSDYGASSVGGVEYYTVNTPIPLTAILMRTNPTITVLNKPFVRNYNNINTQVIDYYATTLQGNNQIVLRFYANGIERGVIYHTYNGKISLDAEL